MSTRSVTTKMSRLVHLGESGEGEDAQETGRRKHTQNLNTGQKS